MRPEIPPGRMRWEMRPAGRDWDAVRMAATLGRPALAQLGDTAAVYYDDGDLVFLVPYDSGGGFGAGTKYLSIGAWLFMPGPQRREGPGVHWLSGNDHTRTPPEALRAALNAVRQQTPEAER
ncbi:hypothetical protein [Streptomyces daliensis]|uniref:Uncharacterized protein n=1 Tax=Streptomyces daliensis TaxID=299421 RepID=A0A8T4IKK9_9ACTN|nr:hypothetical protein [Streptomyces daliensis]